MLALCSSHFQGCNIPDIDIVVQWKLPGSVSAFVQRAGRAARGSGRTGLAVLLVEPAAYKVDLEAVAAEVNKENLPEAERPAKKKGKGKGKKSAKPKGTAGKAYENARGAKCGCLDGKSDTIFVHEQPRLDPEMRDEGLYVFLQTGACRRRVLTEIYGNQPARK